MKLLKRIASRPQRWRHSHGFGVHSPFAFHFITRVLREKDAVYYAYPEIAASCRRYRHSVLNKIYAAKNHPVHQAQMIFRVLCYFNPQTIIEVGMGHKETLVIFNSATPDADIITWQPNKPLPNHMVGHPVLIINQFSLSDIDNLASTILSLTDQQDAVVIVRNLRSNRANRTLWTHISGATNFGMGFNNRYTGIFVARHTLPHQLFNL